MFWSSTQSWSSTKFKVLNFRKVQSHGSPFSSKSRSFKTFQTLERHKVSELHEVQSFEVPQSSQSRVAANFRGLPHLPRPLKEE